MFRRVLCAKIFFMSVFLLITSPAWCIQKIDASEAIVKAKKSVRERGWQIAFVSNTGVTDSVTASSIRSPQEALMDANGKAGQWVVEFFKDTPKSISQGGKKGKAYPLRRVLVTAMEVSDLPDTELGVPNTLPKLDDRYIASIERATKLAMSKVSGKYDLMSIASDVRSSGMCNWVFRFYNAKRGNVVGKIAISGDGRNVVN